MICNFMFVYMYVFILSVSEVVSYIFYFSMTTELYYYFSNNQFYYIDIKGWLFLNTFQYNPWL